MKTQQDKSPADRTVPFPVPGRIREFFQKYKTGILYLFFGGVTTLINVAAFWLFYKPVGLDELTANAVAWVIAFVFAFFVNRNIVFAAKTGERKETLRQFAAFLTGRLFSLLCEELILYLLITKLGLLALPVKVFAQVVVVILNYVISKFVVFKT